MTKEMFPERDSKSVRQATICYLIKNGEVLLTLKKRGFAVGVWNGPGGKVKEEEMIEDAVERETYEEIKVNVRDIKKVALLHFYFPDSPDKKDWNQDVHVFVTDNWTGEPEETEEVRPEWFGINKLPYDKMWDDDILWTPRVLAGERIEAWFAFDDNNKVIAHKIEKLGK